MHEKIKQLIPNKLKSKFTTRPMLQKIFKNIGWMSVERIITLMIGLLVGIQVARSLGPEDFGILSFIGAFFGLFLPFTYLGLSGIVQREIIKNKNNKKILGTAFFLRFLSSFFIFMLVPSIILFLFPGRMDYLIFSIICGVGMLFDSFGVISWYFSAKLI